MLVLLFLIIIMLLPLIYTNIFYVEMTHLMKKSYYNFQFFSSVIDNGFIYRQLFSLNYEKTYNINSMVNFPIYTFDDFDRRKGKYINQQGVQVGDGEEYQLLSTSFLVHYINYLLDGYVVIDGLPKRKSSPNFKFFLTDTYKSVNGIPYNILFRCSDIIEYGLVDSNGNPTEYLKIENKYLLTNGFPPKFPDSFYTLPFIDSDNTKRIIKKVNIGNQFLTSVGICSGSGIDANRFLNGLEEYLIRFIKFYNESDIRKKIRYVSYESKLEFS
jgi:hypothetical protein